jgi:hypothetical protein
LKNENGELALEGVVNLPLWKTRLVPEERRERERGRRGVGPNYARPQLRSANQVPYIIAMLKYFFFGSGTRKTEVGNIVIFLYCKSGMIFSGSDSYSTGTCQVNPDP